MYGLIGSIEAVEGKREELAELLAKGGSMPGCLHYVVATDDDDPSVVWVTEVWESKDAHSASLRLPAVQDLIANGRPLIAGFRRRHETTPVSGGIGLDATPS